jgi:hypothetical protein
MLAGFVHGDTATLTVGGPTIHQPPITWHYQLVRSHGESWLISREWSTEGDARAPAGPAEPVEAARPH